MSDVPPAAAGYAASDAEIREILDWFDRYDALVAAGDLEAMADQAVFPINEVTDSGGFGIAAPCDRERFLEQMRDAVGGAGEVSMESARHPVFLSPALAFVVTDATITVGGDAHHLRYGDLLIRTPDGWRFQTMVAGGFGEQM